MNSEKKRQITHSKNEQGFTLVEILLVIAIVGVLASVLINVIRGQREHARAASFKEQMRTMVSSVSSCIDAGGTIQNPGDFADNRICDVSLIHGAYSPDADRVNCNGVGAYSIVAFADGVLGTCDVSGGLTCTASCTYQGCDFNVNCD